jgi:hypothetical protein
MTPRTVLAIFFGALALAARLQAVPPDLQPEIAFEVAVGARAQTVAPAEPSKTERRETNTPQAECDQGRPKITGGQDFWFKVLGLSAVVSALINATWFFMSWGLLELRHRWSAKKTVYSVTFTRGMTADKYEKVRTISSGFYCLLVHYGTDQYIGTLASDQEKYEGRLKNRILKIETELDGAGNATFILELPVHKRIGTQFKCFVAAKDADSVPVLEEFLKGCDRIHGISASKSVKANRIYFLLDKFSEVTSSDCITNNMIFPE